MKRNQSLLMFYDIRLHSQVDYKFQFFMFQILISYISMF